jgi:hypothetical protein
MRKIILIGLASLAVAVLPSAAVAQEPAKCNFASVQGLKEIGVIPGGECGGNIYFYNIDGNRITHVTLEVSQAPAGWQVEIQPPLSETQVEVNGQVITVIENLYVEPSEASNIEIKDVPEGMVCIPLSNRGYALAKESRIIIQVPAAEEIGTEGAITISAVAQWLGQGGAAALSQSRDLNFTVEVVSEEEYHETILVKGGGVNKWLPWTASGAAVVLLALVTLFYIKKKHG